MKKSNSTRGKKTSTRRIAGRLAMLAPIALSPVQIAVAQELATQSDDALAEVLVTAQKRSENSQKVPISLQVLTPEMLEQHEVTSLDDYSKLLPSVSFQSLGPGQSQLFFRGITSGADGHAYGALPTAGVYLDEVPVTTIGSLLDVHIYDVARIEALSGPQGTLFGASSLAGTLRIITNKPDPSGFSSGYDLQADTFGSSQPGGTMEGFLNVPLNDRAAVRAVAFYRRDAGYIDNTLQQRTYQRPHTLEDGTVVTAPLTVNNASALADDFNHLETYGGRIALGIDLNDSWTVTPSVIAQHQETTGTFLYDPKAGDLKVHDFTPEYSTDEWYQAALAVEGKVSNWDLLYSGGYMKRDNDLVQDYSYYTVAYDEFPDYTYFQNENGTPLDPTQFVREHSKFSKQTHELRVNSPADKRFRLTAGLFLQRQENDHRADFYTPGVSESQQSDFVVTGDSLYLNKALRTDRDYAAFSQANFDLTSSLTLTAGIRGFKYRNNLYGFSGTAGTVSRLGCGTYSASCISLDKEAKGSGETHKASLTWQIDPDLMVYTTYSTGFRPGGINRPLGFASYGADELSNYEAGWKTSWLDRRVRFNGAVYYEDWSKIQYGLAGDLAVVSFVNAGDAHVQGIELDAAVKLGALTLSASGAYNDVTLATDFCTMISGVRHCELGVAAPKGTRLPVQPKFKGNMTARYVFNLGGVEAFAQSSVLYQDKTFSALGLEEREAIGSTPSFTTVDFSIGGALGKTTVELFLQNAFDERGQLSRSSWCSGLVCQESSRVYPVKPQWFGIKFGQRF